jgi:hypothetical protein
MISPAPTTVEPTVYPTQRPNISGGYLTYHQQIPQPADSQNDENDPAERKGSNEEPPSRLPHVTTPPLHRPSEPCEGLPMAALMPSHIFAGSRRPRP